MENNCAVNLALFIFNSNYFQYFTNSSNVNTYLIRAHFDNNWVTFQIPPSKIHFENASFIIYYNSILNLDFLIIHFIFPYYCYNFLFGSIKKLFNCLNLLKIIFWQLNFFSKEFISHLSYSQAFEDPASFLNCLNFFNCFAIFLSISKIIIIYIYWSICFSSCFNTS